VRTRTFGRLGWQVGEVGYGMWGMGGWAGSDDAESFASLELAVERGVDFFDTAFGYGEGHSERLLGQLVRAHPERRLFTATKIPPRNRQFPTRRGDPLDGAFPPDHVREYLEKSLSNLGMASVDLIQFHVWEDAWVDDARWVRELEDIRREGMAAGVGLSLNRWEPWNGVRAVRSGLIDSVQVIYNIFDQAPQDELLPACRESGVAVIARVPFDEGSLTGTLTLETRFPPGDWRNTYFVPENLADSVAHADALKPIGEAAGMSMPEMALRFILTNPDVSVVIPGMRRATNVRRNLESADRGPLPDAMMTRLREHRWDRTPTEWSQ
jgi:aryl-alcohol dehydrogenase-like predicted oxidoreductase